MQTIVLCTISSLLLQTYFILFAALHTYIKLYEAAGERYSYSFLQVFIVAFKPLPSFMSTFILLKIWLLLISILLRCGVFHPSKC